jgi:MFS family permease
MQQQAGLGLAEAGWLAALNYAGYLSGALIASLISDLVLKDRLYRIGLVVAIVSTAMMGLTTDPGCGCCRASSPACPARPACCSAPG